MKGTKIFFDDDDYQFIADYKEASGVSIQQFVTTAIKERIMRLDAEQTIKDQELIKS